MAKQKGRALLIAKNGTAISGQMTGTVTEDGNTIEYETKAMDGPGREYNGKSLTVQAEGTVDADDAGAVAIQAAKEGQTKLTDITVATGLGTYAANFVVESFEMSGEVSNMQNLRFTLKSDGGYTFTAA